MCVAGKFPSQVARLKMNDSLTAVWQNFLGDSPEWYKRTIVGFLVLNPLLVFVVGDLFLAGWVLVLEFIFTLAMALKCYPLQPGGLLAIQSVILGMTMPGTIEKEVFANFSVILLLMFMVAGIYFMRELLLFTFTKIVLTIRSKMLISLLFCAVSAVLSAFLDALTVTAVVITVATGFYSVYHRVQSGGTLADSHESIDPLAELDEEFESDLEQFRAFLRGLMMHAAVGTALGGVCTLVGEPQNLLIAEKLDWTFNEFFLAMVPVSMPVLAVGLVTCLLLEQTKILGYGTLMPASARKVLEDFDREEAARRTTKDKMQLVVQAIAALCLVVALWSHFIEVGIIGLMIIVLQTAFNGVTDEHSIGPAFEEALPFTALLVVFFCIVAVIHEQHLFSPVIDYVLSLDPKVQPQMFYVANGFLSAISDNVFVATVYINEVALAFQSGQINREQYELLAIAINTGTNIPSVATPNGQAAFLFLLTSSLAPLIRLSYMRMVIMAAPYTLTMGVTGYLAVTYLL